MKNDAPQAGPGVSAAGPRPLVIQYTGVGVVPTLNPALTRARVRESLRAFLADELGWDAVMVVVDAGEVPTGG